SAYTAFEVSFRRLPPEMQDFLYIISHYHFAEFPMAVFSHAARQGFISEPYALAPRDSIFSDTISLLKTILFTRDMWNMLTQHSIVRTLQSYSMASFTSGFKTELLRLHPLFCDWVYDRIPSERGLLLLSSAARVLACGQGERWMEPYLLPHIKRIISNPHWERLHINDKAAIGRILREMDHLSDARKVWSSIYHSLQSTEGPAGVALASVTIELAWTHSTDLTKMEALERQALSIFENVLGPDDEKTQLASDSLAGTYVEMGRFKEAEEMMLKSLQRLQSLYDDENPRVVNTMHALALSYYAAHDYPKAEKYQYMVLPVKRKHLGDNHPDTLLAMYNLASIYQCQGKYPEAEKLQVQVLAARKTIYGENHIDTLLSMHELASIYDFQGRYIEAEEMEKEVLKKRIEILGKDHPDTLLSMHNLAFNYQSQGRFTEAEEMQRAVFSGWRNSLGEDHPDTLLAMYGLASCYRSQGRYSEAEVLQAEVLTKRRKALGEDHPDTLLTMSSLASTYFCEGAYAKAEELQLLVLTRRRTLAGEFHPDTLSAMCDLALTYDCQGRYTDTEALETKVMAARMQILGPDHPDTLLAMHNLASTHHSLERYANSEQLESKVVEVRKRLLGENHPDTLIAMHNLASTYRAQQRYAQAEELQLTVIAGRTEVLGETHNDTLSTMESLALTYTKEGRISEATKIQTRLSILQKNPLYQGRIWEFVHVHSFDSTSPFIRVHGAPESCYLKENFLDLYHSRSSGGKYQLSEKANNDIKVLDLVKSKLGMAAGSVGQPFPVHHSSLYQFRRRPKSIFTIIRYISSLSNHYHLFYPTLPRYTAPFNFTSRVFSKSFASSRSQAILMEQESHEGDTSGSLTPTQLEGDSTKPPKTRQPKEPKVKVPRKKEPPPTIPKRSYFPLPQAQFEITGQSVSSSDEASKYLPRLGQFTLRRKKAPVWKWKKESTEADVDQAPIDSTGEDVITLTTPAILCGASRGMVKHLSRDNVALSRGTEWIHIPFEE
ncbi:6565_t:CDS:2, partial [Acaulospora colombiana]